MKTLEEIKKGLECCLDDCDRVGNCPYSGTFGCDECLKRDALAYIEQLESERDVAMKFLVGKCYECKWNSTSICELCDMRRSRWEWRGVQKED